VKKPSRAEMEGLIDAALRNFEGMRHSRIVISIFTESYERDPVALMQFALAVLLDKPLYLLAPAGRAIPANVRSVAAGIETYEDTEASRTAAMERLVKKARQGM
jgi:hypothetical protein